MKFITSREFHDRFSDVLKQLGKKDLLVVTSNGKPRAIVSAISEDDFDDLWLYSSESGKRIQKGLRDITEGKLTPHGKVRKNILGD